MEGAAVRCIHGRIRVVFAQSRRILVQVHHVLWQESGRELAEEELIEPRHVHRRLVDGRRKFEDEVNGRRLAEELESTSLIEDQEIRILYEAERGIVGNACRAESNRVREVDCDVAEERVRQDRGVSVKTDNVCRRWTAFLRHGR